MVDPFPIRRSQRGQTNVMVALAVPLMMLFAAFSINAGKLVNDRMRVQNTVDLASYAGAAVQAQYLNKIKKENKSLLSDARDLREYLYLISNTIGLPFNECPGTCSSCEGTYVAPVFDALIMAADAEFSMRIQKMEQLAKEASERAFQAARNTAKENFKGTDEKMKMLSHSPGDEIVSFSVISADFDYGAWCHNDEYDYPEPGDTRFMAFTLDIGVYKDGSPEDAAFVGFLDGVMPKGTFLPGIQGSATFGEARRLSAYAAAGPYFGKLGPIDGTDFEASDLNESQTTTNGDVLVPDPISDLVDMFSSSYTSGTFRPYKVRFIGLFERDRVRTTRNWEAEVEQLSKMRH